jgi:hypothetical protein
LRPLVPDYVAAQRRRAQRLETSAVTHAN